MNHKANIAAFLIFAAVVFWFTAVDWSWFVDECPDCGYDRDVFQDRIFGHPVSERFAERVTLTQLVSIDLGVECTHPHMQRWHKHRWWGLCVCKSPCLNGSYTLLWDYSWYDANVSSKIAALAERDPTLKTRYVERVLRDHDYDYMRSVLKEAGVKGPDRSESESDE